MNWFRITCRRCGNQEEVGTTSNHVRVILECRSCDREMSATLEPQKMNQPKAFDESGAQFAWDSTSLKLAAECPRKYMLKMIEGWTSYRPSEHLTFGAHYATALETYHKLRALGEDHDPALRTVIRQTLDATWLRDSDGIGQPWQSLDNNKTRETLIRTIIWYLEEFREDNLKTLILSDGTPAVEYSFALPVDNGYVLTGHIDRLVEYGPDPMVTDNKTTGSTITQRYFKQFDLDMQMSQYTLAGRIIYNMPIKGVVIDAAQIAVGFSRFERAPTFRSDSRLNEWYDTTMELIERTRSYTLNNHFPPNYTACGNYGGCPFRDVCGADPQVRTQALKADHYQGKRWDPLEAR